MLIKTLNQINLLLKFFLNAIFFTIKLKSREYMDYKKKSLNKLNKKEREKILKKLDWKAKISLHEGLSQTFDWYINNKSFFNSVSKKLHINRLGLKT